MKLNKKKKILVVSQCFYPEQFRINDICLEWVKRGYQVTALTGIPNYPKGKFYDGYDIRSRKEIWNGIEIHRIPIIPRGSSYIGLILNYLSFIISGFFWSKFTKIDADIVFNFETSPMTQSLVAVWYAKRKKIPCYVYIQDLWPDTVEIVTGIKNPFVIRPIKKIVDYIYSNCDLLFATSPSFVNVIKNRVKNPNKVVYWPQYYEEFYRPIYNCKNFSLSEDDSFKIAFTGNIGKAQKLQILPKVAQKLCNKVNIKFVIVGEGREKKNLIKMIQDLHVEMMFIVMDRQPSEKIPEILSMCDAAFLSFMDDDLFSMIIPAKLQSYMACGMPIIASASGEVERILNEAQCGYCSRMGDIDSLCQNIVNMCKNGRIELEKMGSNAITYCRKYFNKKQLMDYMEIYLDK